MELYLMTWPEVETYLKTKKSLILPIGSTEQHGPTGLLGTDFLTAWEIAKSVGKKTQTMVASPICYGMAVHHMAFPGTNTVLPSTFLLYLKEIIENYAQHGFQKFYVINGHGGNIAPATSTFCEVLRSTAELELQLINWWHQKDCQDYEKKVFGEKNGFHATCGEISACMHLFPDAYKTPKKFDYFDTPTQYTWPKSPVSFRKTFPDGRMGSDPRLATREHGETIFNLAVESICRQITS